MFSTEDVLYRRLLHDENCWQSASCRQFRQRNYFEIYGPFYPRRGLDNITSINNLIGFSVQRRELEKLISAISAHDVFHVLKFGSDGEPIDPDTDAGKPINLLSCTILPSLSGVQASTRFYSQRVTTFFNERTYSGPTMRSKLLVISSCSPFLKQRCYNTWTTSAMAPLSIII